MYSVVWKCERRCPSLRTYRALEHMEIIRAYFNTPPFCTLSETRLQENAGGELVPVLLWSSHCPGTPCCPLVVPPASSPRQHPQTFPAVQPSFILCFCLPRCSQFFQHTNKSLLMSSCWDQYYHPLICLQEFIHSRENVLIRELLRWEFQA